MVCASALSFLYRTTCAIQETSFIIYLFIYFLSTTLSNLNHVTSLLHTLHGFQFKTSLVKKKKKKNNNNGWAVREISCGHDQTHGKDYRRTDGRMDRRIDERSDFHIPSRSPLLVFICGRERGVLHKQKQELISKFHALSLWMGISRHCPNYFVQITHIFYFFFIFFFLKNSVVPH